PNASVGNLLIYAGTVSSLPQDADQPATTGIDLNGVSVDSSLDPVQTSTGNFMYRRTDIAIAGRGPSPSLERAYNSASTRVSPLGPGWTFNYNVHLASASGGSLTLVSPQGGSNLYTPG